MAFDPLTKGYIALHPAEAARTLARLESRESRAVFQVMPRQLAAKVLEYMTPSSASRCLAELTAKTAGEILARMPVAAAVAPLRLMKASNDSRDSFDSYVITWRGRPKWN